MFRHPAPRSLLVRIVLGTASVLATVPAPCATRMITIENMQFSPSSLVVDRGDAVIWTNKDLVAHTVTAAKKFDSGSIVPGGSWRMATTKPGRYEYICSLHPSMKAVLIIR